MLGATKGMGRAVARLRDEGVSLRDIAVLFRTNAQSENFEQALAELVGTGFGEGVDP
jgi:superfamily I DNA/RNA helicase